MVHILGISAWYHDSAACLITDGVIIAAVQEERFTRKKHDASFPKNAIQYCMKKGKISSNDITAVVFYDKPLLKFERIVETFLDYAPLGFGGFTQAFPLWVKDKIFHKRNISIALSKCIGGSASLGKKIYFSEHHFSHAASAFYPSPFKDAAVLTIDGVGEWATTSLATGKDNLLEIEKEIYFPHSIGLLYAAFTDYLGYKVNSGEYKVMGLAPYGEPRYLNLIKEYLIDIAQDGSFRLNMEYFDFCIKGTMTNEKFNALLGGVPRKPESELSQRDMDIAASIQKLTEEIIIKICLNISKTSDQKNLCLAGGVALNCVANGELLRANLFKNIWIQPAAGDAGGAIGAALGYYHLHCGKPRNYTENNDIMQGSYLGPSFSGDEIRKTLKDLGAKFKESTYGDVIEETANHLADGKAIGWMQGRMEFGPRALGNRSILADPRNINMQKQLNLKVKFRESFRPFAPSILASQANKWFDIDVDSPYMLIVASIQKSVQKEMSEAENKLFGIDKLNVSRSQVPAITHVDYSSRVQTVHSKTNQTYHDLIEKFYELTECPLLVNTSFNVRGEPIVCTPDDAFRCFMGTGLDVLVVDNFIMIKAEQDQDMAEDYKNKYELD